MQLLGLQLDSPFVAAPMAGVTSLPFRLSLKRGGASLVYTEMVSAAGLVRQQPHTVRLLRTMAEEAPLAVQLFGAEPAAVEKAARLLRQQYGAAMLDINMGCPVRKVRRTGAGSALLDKPHLAGQVLDAASQGFAGPVSVKIRLGYNRNCLEEITPHLTNAGAITLHARTVTQGYSGQADRQAISWLKQRCSQPILGNGDVNSAGDAIAMLSQTGCDGVMIGRACLHHPFIFAEAKALLLGHKFIAPDNRFIRNMLHEQAELALKLEGEQMAVHVARMFIMWKVRGRSGVSELRRRAGQSKNLSELLAIADEYFIVQEDKACA